MLSSVIHSIRLTFLMLFGVSFLYAQSTGRITEVSIGNNDMVRLAIEAAGTGDQLLLESADSPAGPWHPEPEFTRRQVAGGFEFLTPHRAYIRQQYYRFTLFSFSPVAAQSLPYIRFLSPNTQIQPGQFVTLFGANFDPNPADNTVRFDLPIRSWTAAVTQAATNYLIVRVPTNLIANATNSTPYRVSATTTAGTGNVVGASIQKGFDNLTIRPENPYIAQPPGSGMQTLVIGGGTPPYSLFQLSAFDQKNATATLNGPLVQVTATTNAHFANVRVGIQDSSTNSPRSASVSVGIVTVDYHPRFTAQFETLLAGTAPAADLNAVLSESSYGSFATDQLQLELDNVRVDLTHRHSGDIIGLLQFYDPGGPYYYTFQHLVITNVTPEQAIFNLVSTENGGRTIVGQGLLTSDPPAILLNIFNLRPAVLVSQPLTLKFVLTDQILQLPATGGEKFSVTAHFSSVSTLEDIYHPQSAAITNVFTTTDLPAGSPRLERLLPLEGEIFRNVTLRGSNFPPSPLPSNAVTFAGPGGTRVTAKVTAITNDEWVVAVPPTAVTGPVRVTSAEKVSNDYLFAVRFHPDTMLLLDEFTPNTPTTLRVFHQQPQDEHETADEMPLQSVFCKLTGGHLAISNFSSNQLVGTVSVSNSFTDNTSTNVLVYLGQEQSDAKRHVFQEQIAGSSRYVLATLYLSEAADGVTLEIEGGDGIFSFSAGIAYDFRFSTPIFVPDGNQVGIRVEAISQRWTSIPGSEMHVIWNSIQYAE